jgi:hypothetical protein
VDAVAIIDCGDPRAHGADVGYDSTDVGRLLIPGNR